jgi:MYXO-CTERM domain-containing protein
MNRPLLALASLGATSLSLLTLSAAAQPAAGLYVAEFDDGSVVDISGGGDFTNTTRFATGLGEPGDMCIGPNNDLFVAEFADGEVTIITAGGDFSNVAAFATGLTGPISLRCTTTQVLVGEYESGEVTDITLGGDMTNTAAFAFGFGVNSVLGLMFDSSNKLWVSTEGGVHDITLGGDFNNAAPYATSAGRTLGMTEFNAQLLVADDNSSLVKNFTAGGNNLPNFATNVPFVINVKQVPGVGLLASSSTSGVIIGVSGGGDQSNTVPYATGLGPVVYGILNYGCGDGMLQQGETCDDMGESATCDDDCTAASCGDGTVNMTAGEDCDDMAESMTCNADCTTAACGDNELNTTAGEQCDDGNVLDGDGCSSICETEPGGSGGAGGIGGAGSSSSSSTGQGGAGGNTAVTTGTGGPGPNGDVSVDDGCGCAVVGVDRSRYGFSALAALALLVARRRRRRRS